MSAQLGAKLKLHLNQTAMVNLKIIKSIRLRYLLALGAVALALTASYFTLQRVVSEQRQFSNLVNLAAHQSGLANRIASYSRLMVTTADKSEFLTAQARVGPSITRMQSAHHALRFGAPEKGIPLVVNDNLRELFEAPTVGLDRVVALFIERAAEIQKSDMGSFPRGSATYPFLAFGGPRALESALDALAEEYQRIGNEAILRIEKIELILWLSALFILVLVVGLIFYPMERSVRKTINSFETSIDDLTEAGKRLLHAQQLASVGDWLLNVREGSLTWSDTIYEICGVSPESFEVTVASAQRLVHPEDRTAVYSSLRKLRKDQTQISSLEYRIIRPDGSERLVYQRVTCQKNSAGKVEILSGTIQDYTDRKELSNRLEKLSENIPGFLFEFELDGDGQLSFPYASDGILDTIGVSTEDIQLDPRTALSLFHPDDLGRINITVFESAEKMQVWQDQFRVKHPQKGELWLEAQATPQRLPDGGAHWYGYIIDISERKHSEDKVKRLALYDPLTGLANRRLLEDRLKYAIANSRRYRSFGAVLMLDLDHFKSLNDTKGHHVGDELLIEVANRLRKCVRETYTISRLGGDEFVVLVDSLGGGIKNGSRQASTIADKIRTSLNQTYYLSDGKDVHHASASIGVAMFQGDGRDSGELLKRADVAMFEAKDLGRNRVCFFTEQRQAVINSRTAMAHDMQRALDNNEFSMHYQPQVSITGAMCGAEALIRWYPPDKDPISPGTFIPVAEDTGLIIPIGEWVLRTVCRHVLNFGFYNLPEGFAVAVNISARQFSDDDFLEKVAETLHRTGVETQRIKLELTESCLIHDLERGIENLTKLREMGLRIELDDFGTGYSSLNSLKNLPLDTIKLDASLIRGIEGDIRDAAIIRAAIAMGKALSLTVIAEGVETVEHNDFLVKEGCDVLQGYLHAKPLPYRTFLTYLRNQEFVYQDDIDQENSTILTL